MMKRILYTLLATALIASCQKADDNGDLGGNWKLLQIEDFAKDSIIGTKSDGISWAIQLDLLAVNAREDLTHSGKGRFQHVGDSLFVQMIDIPRKPEKFGLYNPTDERFEVIELNRNRMLLRSRFALLKFRKF